MRACNYLFILLFSFYFFACKNKPAANHNEYETITINFDESKKIDISEKTKIKEIPLEATRYSLLTYIEQIEIENNEIFVYDAHRVIVFDMDGYFLSHLNRKGRGPGEYTNINSFFLEEGKICVYDNNLEKLLIYDKNYDFLESKETTENMLSIYPIGDRMFAGKKKYQGDRVRVSTLAVLDNELKLSFDINNRYFTSGIGTCDYCSSYDNNVLYWEFLNDTIFTIKQERLMPKFYVDFKEFKIPAKEKENKKISDIIEFINSSNSHYATGVRYVQEDSLSVRFIFAFDEGLNYVRYDKKTKGVSLYHFYDSTKLLSLNYFMKFINGKIILSASKHDDEESNPCLLFIDEK